jgi:MFS family permease
MTHRSLTFRLCLMMFFEQGVRGMWYPFLANYLTAPKAAHGLGFSSGQAGWVLGFANAVGAITAPWVAGQVADRYLNAEKSLALLHVIAAVLLLATASATSFAPFVVLMVLFSIAYVPTQSLTNSLAMTHIPDREHGFPRVRSWGTVGWMVTSGLFTYLYLRSPDPAVNTARIADSLRAAAFLAIAYAAFAFFFLPETRPTRAPEPAAPNNGDPSPRSVHPSSFRLHPSRFRPSPAVARAFSLLRDPSVLAVTLIAIPVAAIHTAYYLNIGPFLSSVVGVPQKLLGPTLAISQLSEVFLLIALGPLLRRFGYTTLLTVGAAAQALRFVIFAVDPSAPIVIVSLALHGVAYACFFTTAVLYIQRSAPPDIRHSAQTVFGIVLYGVGPALAGPYSELFDLFVKDGRPNFRAVWTIQAVVATASALAVLLFFRPKPVPQTEPTPEEDVPEEAAVE